MALDPQAQVIVDFMSEMGIFTDTSMSAVDLRAMMNASSAEVVTPVTNVFDQVVPGGAGQDMTVRVYQPEGAAGGPVVVFFHGGGWVLASIDTHDDTCRRMANLTGATWVSVDYRLAPEHRFPAAPEDCWAALEWVRGNADSLEVDATRVGVCGDSAGGNLAAVTALRARDQGVPVQAQALIYPCADMHSDAWPSMQENASGYFLTTDFMNWFYDQYMAEADRTDPMAAPLHAADHSNLPPAIVITAEYDPLRDEGEAYAAKLESAGTSTVATRYDGLIHGFFGLTDGIDRAADAQAEVAAFFASAFA